MGSMLAAIGSAVGLEICGDSRMLNDHLLDIAMVGRIDIIIMTESLEERHTTCLSLLMSR